MVKLRGGQRKHWAEEARILAWYAVVKGRCGWSDYQLNYEFAWTEEGLKSRSTDSRPRTFEWIRKKARKPAGRDRRWRSIEDILGAVESHPNFRGTKSIYEAEIWDLFQKTAMAPDVLEECIELLLKNNKLVRVPVQREFAKNPHLIEKFGVPTLFDRCLLISIRHIDKLSALALVWCLYLQTEPAHNSRIRAVVEAIADNLLDHFFAHYLPSRHLEYYTNSIDALLGARLDLSSWGVCGYGSIELVGTWLVVPECMSGTLTEATLSAELWNAALVTSWSD